MLTVVILHLRKLSELNSYVGLPQLNVQPVKILFEFQHSLLQNIWFILPIRALLLQDGSTNFVWLSLPITYFYRKIVSKKS